MAPDVQSDPRLDPRIKAVLAMIPPVEPTDAADRDQVRLYFSAPAEAPTTRGFASILAAGLDGQPVDKILAVPEDFYAELGLAKLISPLRLRGMSAMLARIKRRLREA